MTSRRRVARVRVSSVGALRRWTLPAVVVLAGAGLAIAVAVAAAGGWPGSGNRPVVGVIIDVKATSITEIDTFTLRDDQGDQIVFHIAPDAARDPQEGFVAGHLRSHALAAEKVRVTYRKQGDELLAEKLEHCGAAIPPC